MIFHLSLNIYDQPSHTLALIAGDFQTAIESVQSMARDFKLEFESDGTFGYILTETELCQYLNAPKTSKELNLSQIIVRVGRRIKRDYTSLSTAANRAASGSFEYSQQTGNT